MISSFLTHEEKCFTTVFILENQLNFDMNSVPVEIKSLFGPAAPTFLK